MLHNPAGRPARVHFTFPLPTGSGTLSEVKFLADGKPVAVTDLVGGYVWDGTLPDNGTATFEIAYANQAARGLAYRSRAVANRSPSSISRPRKSRAEVRALFALPTTSSHEIGGADTVEWHLQNVVTAQDCVAVVLAVRALGHRFVLPVVLATLTMLAFLFVTNTSLLLAADGTPALWALVPLPGLDFVRDLSARSYPMES